MANWVIKRTSSYNGKDYQPMWFKRVFLGFNEWGNKTDAKIFKTKKAATEFAKAQCHTGRIEIERLS